MDQATETDSFLQSLGESLGGFLAGLPSAIGSFFSGVGQGAGVHGLIDWIALVVGIALMISVVRGVRAGRIVGPALRGVIGVALMGWAVS
jgi:hypothetical protein